MLAVFLGYRHVATTLPHCTHSPSFFPFLLLLVARLVVFGAFGGILGHLLLLWMTLELLGLGLFASLPLSVAVGWPLPRCLCLRGGGRAGLGQRGGRAGW